LRLSTRGLLQAAAAAAAFFFAVAWAQHAGDITLVSGPGAGLTQSKCQICHELRHIERARLSRGEWADNLKNMRERGTPMTDEELAIILDYLAAYYSRDPAPPPAPDTLAAGGGDPMAALLQAHACSTCHTVEKAVVGPAFRDIAKRYARQADAPALLARKIRQGGQGAWGQVPMPPATTLSDTELTTLVQWVLQQK
jgi:cytochrome c551/c552